MGNWKSGGKRNPESNISLTTNSDQHGGRYDVRKDPMWKTQEKDDSAYKRFATRVQGRKGLKELASYSSDNPKVAKLLDLIDDPRFRSYGIKALSKRVGMTLPELINLFRNKHFMEMFIEFFDGAPEIARDTVIDAKARIDICPACQGFKTLTRKDETIICPKCNGRGVIRVGGDKEARRDVLKAIGVHQDSAQVVVNNTNVNVEGIEDFEDLMKSAKPPAKIINVTPIKLEED
jgi:hypothetical protein